MKRWPLVIYVIFLSQIANSQAPDTTVLIAGKGTRGPYLLGFRNLVAGSLSIRKNGIAVDSDSFSVEYVDGALMLNEPLGSSDTIFASFSFIPLELKRQYSLHELQEKSNSTTETPVQPPRLEKFNSDLKITGSKGFAIRTGEGSPDGLSQSLNLTITGELVPGLKTSANISDKSSVKSGSTRRLDELDKIYIQTESDHFTGTFGDFDIQHLDDPLLGYRRRLTGIKADYSKRGNRIGGSAAFFPGEYRTITVNGSDGQLGPYYLSDAGGRQGAQILPGSERVYLDGVLQNRGSQSDYEIDYEAGAILFTPSKVIRSESRITVDYEVAREEYSRSFYTISGAGNTTGNLRLFSSLIQEGDNKNSPKSFELTSEARQILEAAGADRLQASRSGAQFVGPGAGDYNLDTTGMIHYVYVGEDGGSYNVSFSFVGTAQGSYKALGGGVFEFVGQALGDYEPVILIPLPEVKKYGSIGAGWKSGDSAFSFLGEMSGSYYDLNAHSSKDRTQSDLSFLGTASYKKSAFGTGGFVGLKALARVIGNNAVFPGRIDEVERYRQYDLGNLSTPQGEEVEEVEVAASIDQKRRISFNLGHLTHPELTDRNHQALNASWSIVGPLAWISNTERTRGDRTWWKASNILAATFRRWKPSLGLNFETRNGNEGLRYFEYLGTLPVEYSSRIDGATEIAVRDERYFDGSWRDKFISGMLQQKLSLIIANSGFSGDLAVSYYKKEFKEYSGADAEQRTGWTRITYSDPAGRGSVSISERLSSSNERVQARSYLFVGDGRGEYRLEDGEYIRDPQGDYILIIEELGDGAMAAEISTAIGGNASPLLLFDGTREIERASGRLNVEADLNYRLRKSSQQLIGRDFVPWDFERGSQAAFQTGELGMRIYYYPPIGNHRIKHNMMRSFERGSQYANEEANNRGRSDELSWSFPVSKQIDMVVTGLLSKTERSINDLKYTVERQSAGGLSNYRFKKQWILSAGASYETARQSENGLRAKMPSGELGLARDLKRSGRISARALITRLEVNQQESYIPFQVARGKGRGNNFEAIISARMEITKNGRFDVSYRYENFAGRAQKHDLRMEFTVLFL